MSALWKGWGVCIKSTRGQWSHPQYVGRTRAEAIRNYDELFSPGEFDTDKRKGNCVCVRVELCEVTP